MSQSRRKFIKTTGIASFSLVPVANVLANNISDESAAGNELKKKLIAAFSDKPDFHFIDKNLINLHFYFINVTATKGALYRKGEGKSYMIVRLPQMHLSEQGFFLEENEVDLNSKLAEAKLSGYSFLAFEVNEGGRLNKNEKLIGFNIRYLLDWNNKKLKLITLLDWIKIKDDKEFDFITKACIRSKKFLLRSDLDRKETNYNNKKIEFKDSKNFNNYQKIVFQFLDNLTGNNSDENFIPITLLEAPEGMCLTPIIRDENGFIKTVKFNRNILTGDDKAKNGIKKYEVWNNGFLIKKELAPFPKDKFNLNFNKLLNNNKSFETELPSFRIAGIIIDKDAKHELITKRIDDCDDIGQTLNCGEFCNEQKGENFLPSLLDKLELTFLTQYANDVASNNKDRDFRQKDFDIKEQNGLLFTGLGLITHLKYDNLEKLPDKIDLIEYEHKIIQGRDVYVKVARLGYNSQTGQRYKHIIEGKRKITGASPTSFIELKQYCEPIDITIKYHDEEDRLKEYQTINENWIDRNNQMLNPISKFSEKCDFKRFPYRKITSINKTKIPIRCLKEKVQQQEVCTIQCLTWFWPVQESLTKTNQENSIIDYDTYLHCDYEAEDWEGNIIKAKTPFIFIRKSFVEDITDTKLKELYKNYFSPDQEEGNLCKRRKTFINLQKIAYTPLTRKGFEDDQNDFKSQEDAITDQNDKNKKNKVNKLETHFFETYFQIKTKQSVDNSGVNLVNNKLVVFPQLLRSKVYLDHVQDITLEKIPSVIEYHKDYIHYGFDDYTTQKDNNGVLVGNIKGNGAQLILANTNAFIQGYEETINNKWQDIANALAKAKKFTGNLVASDSVFDTLSLSKLGASLPKEFKESVKKGEILLDDVQSGVNAIQNFDPRALLRGKLKNVCGLDLTQILDEFIPKDSGPLFEIQNKINELGTDVLNSEVYKEITGSLEVLKRELNTAGDAYESSLVNLERIRINYNSTINELSKLITNEEDLKNAMIKEFEKGQLIALNYIDTLKTDYTSKYLADFKTKFEIPFNDFIDNKITELTISVFNNYNRIIKLEEQLITLQKQHPKLNNYIEDLLKLLGDENLRKTIETYFKWEINEDGSLKKIEIDATKEAIKKVFLEPYLNNVAEINTNNYFFDIETLRISKDKKTLEKEDYGNRVEELKLPENLGRIGKIQLQKRIDDINLFLVRNLNDTDVNAFLKSKLQDFKNQLTTINSKHKGFIELINTNYTQPLISLRDKLITCLDSEKYPDFKNKKDQLNFVINVIDEIINGLKLLQQVDPGFYLERYNNLEKELSEIVNRVNDKFILEFNNAIQKVSFLVNSYDKEYGKYIKLLYEYYKILGQGNLIEIFKSQEKLKIISNQFQPIVDEFLTDLKNEYPKLIEDYEYYKGELLSAEEKLSEYRESYEAKLKEVERQTKAGFEEKLAEFIENNRESIDKIREAERIYKLLRFIKQKDVTYKWNIDNFSDKRLGFISFHKQADPKTQLVVDAKSTVYFKPNVFPPVVDRVENYAINKFQYFKIGIFNSLFVDFNEVSFSSGTNQSSKFDVKIKDVKFEGVLSFVQAFEQYFKTMDTGFIKSIEKDRVKLGYSLPIPAIKTPSFNFFNLSLNFTIQIFFDNRPIEFEFSLARKDSMFGLSVGIYAGFGYFSIKANPQDGIVELETALEGGAWAGINIGPIRGEVKLAFGFYFRKTANSTMLTGYFIAQGRLSVWIIRANATIYLGIYSENGNIVGVGYAKLSIKVGFAKKSFSGSYKKVMKRSKNDKAETYKKIREDLINADIIPENKLLRESDFMSQIQEMVDNETMKNCDPIKKDSWDLFINVF